MTTLTDLVDQTAYKGLKLQKGLIEGREPSNPNPTLFPVRGFNWRTSTILKTTKKKHHVDLLNRLITMMNSGKLGLVLVKIASSITRKRKTNMTSRLLGKTIQVIVCT